jgi:hypothetical protein
MMFPPRYFIKQLRNKENQNAIHVINFVSLLLCSVERSGMQASNVQGLIGHYHL